MYIKKTLDDMLDDSHIRARNQYFVINRYNEEMYSVYNEKTGGEYIVTVDSYTNEVLECTCPHFKYRLCGIAANISIPCKHMVAVEEYLQYDN